MSPAAFAGCAPLNGGLPPLPVFCEACQDQSGLYGKVSKMLPVRVASYMLLPYTLPVQSAYSVAQR